MSSFESPVAVGADPSSDGALVARAAKLAADLGLPQVLPDNSGGGYRMLLMVTAARLELRVVGDKGLPVIADPGRKDVTSPAGRSCKQPLARALGIKRRADLPVSVIDATAGFGEDSWLMAGLGCDVLAVERHRVVAALLSDGLRRAGMVQPGPAGRIEQVTGDAAEVLESLARGQKWFKPDVVYLDPMYPRPRGRGRKTAERKAMKVVRELVGDDGDASLLFNVALRAAGKRVVVKRPPKAEPLGEGKLPGVVHAHKGKGVRYDVYAVSRSE